MWFEELHAEAFGPLRDAHLAFGPGLNVVHGANEAGKSSWHAALLASLAGRRRPARSKEERAFAHRHRPWAGERGWSVRAYVVLTDGRRLEVRQDLDQPANSVVVDRDSGKDVGAELGLVSEGGIDAAPLVGLTRASLERTLSVAQGELHPQAIAERDEAEKRRRTEVQHLLSRAASRLEGEGSAARARERLDAFYRERVGVRREGSTKPLQAAIDAVRRAEEQVAAAEEAQREHAELLARIDRARARWQRARSAEARENLARLAALDAEFPAGAEGLEARERSIAALRRALQRWDERPVGEADEDGAMPARREAIAERLRALAVHPDDGDRTEHAEVAQCAAAYALTADKLADHRREHATSRRGGMDASAGTPDALRELARALEDDLPAVDDALERRVGEARARRDRARRAVRWFAIATLASVGAALLAFAFVHVAVSAILLGIALFCTARVAGASSRARLTEVGEREAAELRLQETTRAHAERARSEAERRARSAGLDPDPEALRKAARALEAQERGRTLERAVREAEQALRTALERRAPELATDDVAPWLERYRRRCRALDERDRLRGEAEVLDAREDARRRRQDALAGLRAEAAQRALDEPDPARLAPRLRSALEAEQRELDAARERFAERERLGARREAWERAAAEDAGFGVAGDDEPLRGAAEEQAAWERLEAVREDRERVLPDLAAAREALARRGEELARVERLEQTFERTKEFLERAHDQFQRNITPALNAALARHVGALTRGRYREVQVHAETNTVSVRLPHGAFKKARWLSHGTAEQLQLLLRLALVDALVPPGEGAPVLLDDALVHTDRPRKLRWLELLHERSRTQQVILFTQEEFVVEWAEERAAERDRVVRLPDPADTGVTAVDGLLEPGDGAA